MLRDITHQNNSFLLRLIQSSQSVLHGAQTYALPKKGSKNLNSLVNIPLCVPFLKIRNCEHSKDSETSWVKKICLTIVYTMVAIISFFFFFFFFFFFPPRVARAAYGSSQARGRIPLNPLNGARDWTHILKDTTGVWYLWATIGIPITTFLVCFLDGEGSFWETLAWDQERKIQKDYIFLRFQVLVCSEVLAPPWCNHTKIHHPLQEHLCSAEISLTILLNIWNLPPINFRCFL